MAEESAFAQLNTSHDSDEDICIESMRLLRSAKLKDIIAERPQCNAGCDTTVLCTLSKTCAMLASEHDTIHEADLT